MDEYAQEYFILKDSNFYVIVKDTLKIKIGDDIKSFEKVINPNYHIKNRYIGPGYGGISTVSIFSFPYHSYRYLAFIYNPETNKIIQIRDNPIP